MEHHGDRGRSHADLVAMARILGIQPGGESDFVADACHDAQVVQAFIDVPICCSHQESSAAVDSTLPIFAKPVNQSAECGAQGVIQIKNDGTPAKVQPEELLQGDELELAYVRANLDAIRLPNGYCFKPKAMDCPAANTPCYTCRAFVTTPVFLPQLEQEIRDLETQVELGEAAGRSHWVEANRRKLIKLTPIADLLRAGQIHQPLEKHKREYAPPEDKKPAKPLQERKG